MLSAALGVMASGATAAAQAPAAPPVDSAARARDSVARLPAVTVTAARAPRAALDVPAAVSILNPRDYAGRRGIGIDEALAAVPGVLAQSRYGASDVRLVIRGFGARGAGDRSNAGTSRGVRVLVDGVPETEPDGRTAFDNVDLAAAEGIEVVRSNASALWGNAAGGVVALSTVPRFDRSLAELQSQAGSFGLRRYVARLGTRVGEGPDAPTLYGTLTNSDFGGWRERSSMRRTSLAAGLVVPVGAAGGAGAAPTTVRVTLLATDNRFDIPGPLTADQVAADPRQANALYATRRERRHNRVARVAASADHRVGPHALGGTMFLNPKYLQRSERGTYRDFTRQHMGGNLVYAYEGAVAGRAHRITAGVDGAYQDGAILFYSLTPAGTRGTTLRTNKSEAAANLGAFAQDEISLGGRATLTLGTRYDAVRYDYRDFIAPRLDDRRGFARLTPKLGLSVRVAPLHAVYAAVGGGLEAPAGNETDPAPPLDTVRAINPLLDPIRSTTYETGAKGTFFRSGAAVRRLAYDAALYLTDVRNEIVPYAGGRFYFTAGRARRAGAELGLSADVAGGFALRAAGTLNRHRYADYVVDSVHYGRAGVLADYGGNHVVGVPDLFYSGEAIWSARDALPGGALGRTGVELRLGVQGTGPYFADDANRVRVAPYTVTSATLSFAPTFGRRAPLLPGGAGSGVRAFVTVENLLDRRYTASAFLNPDRLGGAPLAFEPGLPRGVVIGLSVGHRR